MSLKESKANAVKETLIEDHLRTGVVFTEPFRVIRGGMYNSTSTINNTPNILENIKSND